MLHKGHDSAPGLDIMVLKLQFISVSAQPADPARQHPPIEFASTTIMTLLTHFSSTVAGRFNRSDEDIQLDLVFFSPFEELRLRTAGIIESNGIHRVYEPSPVPTLYVGRVEDLLGRVPLIPCFLDGNATSTIPHKYSSRQQDAFEYGCADGAGPSGGAAMFTRSTPGCGTLDGPSLAWAASLWPKLRRSEGSPGLRLPSADGQLRRLGSDLHMVYA